MALVSQTDGEPMERSEKSKRRTKLRVRSPREMGPMRPKVARLELRRVLITKISESISNKYRVWVRTKEDLTGFATLDAGHCGVPQRTISSALSGCAWPFQPVLGGGQRQQRGAAVRHMNGVPFR